ncbi:hypothetical protein [Tenacibaculum sp. 190524A05c]|uniref:hypothetical protein n=1 Tax=Tenacibaculum platacis TaxID=3137852 RepID=UPI0032B1A8A1
MKQHIEEISDLIENKNIRYEIHSFDSNAYIIDIWINNGFYCIQLFDYKFGISKVTEEIDFNTIPDKTFNEWEDFKFELEKIINE